MDAYSIGALIGAGVGLLIGLVLVVILYKFANKNKKLKTEYDERQKILRGEGYKYGFYAMFIYSGINTILGVANISLPMEPAVLGFTYIMVGAMVDVAYCIFHDCYWGQNNDRKKYLIVFAVVGLINAAAFIRALSVGAAIYEGRLSSPGINLFCAILMIFLAICLGIKSIIDKKEAAE